MKKINTFTMLHGKPIDIMTLTQMTTVRGGTLNTSDVLCALVIPDVTPGPTCATNDDKRRDRPGGGISTH